MFHIVEETLSFQGISTVATSFLGRGQSGRRQPNLLPYNCSGSAAYASIALANQFLRHLQYRLTNVAPSLDHWATTLC